MGKSQSDLSDPKYGYDFVISISESSINSTLNTFLSKENFSEIVAYYVADDNGNPTQISYQQLLAKSNVSDPFSIPNGSDSDTNSDIGNLIKAGFLCAFKATIGVPSAGQEGEPTKIITVNNSNTTFNLLCSEFSLIQLTPQEGNSSAQWLNLIQPESNRWLFMANVPYKVLTIPQNQYNELPQAINNQVSKVKSGTYSIQQISFDFENVTVKTVPEIPGVSSKSRLGDCLQKYFTGMYFTELQKVGNPMLACNLVYTQPDSLFDPTSIEYEASPNVSTNGLTTFCFLYETHATQLSKEPFSWNWIESTDKANGVIAINRSLLVNYLRSVLYPIAARQSYSVQARVWTQGIMENAMFSWMLIPNNNPVFQSGSGINLLNFSYGSNASDQAGMGTDYIALKSQYSLQLNVYELGFTIVQNLVVSCAVREEAMSAQGDILDIKIEENYTLSGQNGVDGFGLSGNTIETDNSKVLGANGFMSFFSGLNRLSENVKQWKKSFVPTDLMSIPVPLGIFPEGNQFTMKNASFSDSQDLVADIFYTDSGTVNMAILPE